MPQRQQTTFPTIKNHDMRHLLLTLTLVFITLSATAEKIIFYTHWMPQSQFVGYYAAREKGFYAQEGLDVSIRHPEPSDDVCNFLKEKKTDIALLYLSDAITARINGLKIVNVMQLLQQSSLMFVSHYPLRSMRDLNHYSIGMWGYMTPKFISNAFSLWGISTKNVVRFSDGVNPFLSKALDVSIVTSYNEYYTLEECGFKCKYKMRWSDYGYDIAEDGLYVTTEYYKKHRETIDKFIRATRKGWEWVSDNPAKALQIVLKQIRANQGGKNAYHQRKEMEEVLRLLTNKRTGKRSYRLDKRDFDAAMKIMHATGKISYNDFVK
jgi:NitT/TauT family transport system substrate-binding protein